MYVSYNIQRISSHMAGAQGVILGSSAPPFSSRLGLFTRFLSLILSLSEYLTDQHR
ncbi:hypothetical protein M404DRAFT_34769 [Pisolithus tinctorius Marx 270]|uniref:Uncharacterized protein n=1 Tax=Pisolithus tinctorius Marx 270 TaxID=870435 RepID=A0A0C3NG53_PISTI|nr:hypothetical protein M404DRAFT_34769 [Pisolithus tinctorius Marx 270]